MDFEFTEEQKMWRKMLQDFVEKEAGREYARQCDMEGRYPQRLWEKGVEQGFLGLMIPQEYGGMGADAIHFAIFCECLSKYSYEMASIFTVPMFCAMNVVHHGTPEQKKRYLPLFIEGKQRFSISITEPDAGVDAASVSTFAELKGDHFLVNGAKQFSTGAHLPNNIMVMATRTDRNVPKQKGITALLVPNNLPGVECKVLPLIVRRAVGTCAVFLQDVKVSKENLLGRINGGWEIMTGHLDLERMANAAANVGEGQSALDDAVSHAKTRVQFGQPIGKFQEIGHRLGELWAELEAARWLTYRLAWRVSKGMPSRAEASQAKLISSEVFYRITTMGMQVFGGYSFLPESDMERHWRISKLMVIGGGTSEIQRMILSRSLGL